MIFGNKVKSVFLILLYNVMNGHYNIDIEFIT